MCYAVRQEPDPPTNLRLEACVPRQVKAGGSEPQTEGRASARPQRFPYAPVLQKQDPPHLRAHVGQVIG